MAHYIDGYVIPIPKKNINAYRRLAQKAMKVWRDHGALGLQRMRRRRFERENGATVSTRDQNQVCRNGLIFLDCLQIARALRPRER